MAVLTLDEAVAEFLLEAKHTGKRSHTLSQYSRALRYFRDYEREMGEILLRFGGRPVDSFTRSDVTAFAGYLASERGLSRVSVHDYMRPVRTFFNWALDAELIREPVKVVMPKVPSKEAVALSVGEMNAIMDAAKRRHKQSGRLNHWRDRVMCLLLAYTGIRRSEVVGIRIEDVDLEGEPPTLLIREGKMGKDRRVVLNPGIVLELVRYRRELKAEGFKHFIFSDRSPNNRLSPDIPNRILYRLAKLAGVKKSRASCHRWRHGCGKYLTEQGVPLQVVQIILGHSDPRITAGLYAHAGLAAQAAAMEKVSLKRK